LDTKRRCHTSKLSTSYSETPQAIYCEHGYDDLHDWNEVGGKLSDLHMVFEKDTVIRFEVGIGNGMGLQVVIGKHPRSLSRQR
jgi:hypothetical protein